jgi:hypothetical protein
LGLFRFAALMVATTLAPQVAFATDCRSRAGEIRSIRVAGSARDDRLAQLAASSAIDIARSDSSATIAIAASELRAHIGKLSTVPIVVKAGTPTRCEQAVLLSLTPSAPPGAQSFQLQTFEGNLIVTAGSPIGLLYGAYEALYIMGFRWYGQSDLWASAPTGPVRVPELTAALTYEPRFLLRGAVTFDATVPDNHLLWMARNRQNLIGSSGVDATVARALGIHLDDGGHHVISTIIHSSRVVEGKTLIDAHPDWYGLQGPSAGTRTDSIPYKSETYENPCFANQGLIAFFGIELASRLIDGDLKDVSFLHLWPSDRTALNLPASCLAQLRDAKPIEHLIRFYSGVMDILQSEIARRKPDRKVTIAGISYYDTWKLAPAASLAQLVPRPNVGFMQVLYVNERSYAEPIAAAQVGTNARIEKAIAAWSRALVPLGIGIGICEYYGYSAYYSMPAVFQHVIEPDFETYDRRSVSFMNYMHPLQPDASPQRLLEALRSRLFWRGAEPARAVVEDYFQRMFGSTEIMAAFHDVDEALSNIAEILGGTSSLLNMLGQHKMWAKPAFPEAEVPQAVGIYRRGGQHRLPLVRDTYFSPLESEFRGLTASLDLLRSAERHLNTILADATGDRKARLERDLLWVSHARAIYEAIATIADAVAAPDRNRVTRADAEQRLDAALKEVSRLGRFGWTLSGYDQKKLFEERMTYARSRLEALQ